MGLTYTTLPKTTALTTLRRVKVELGLDLAATTYDELLTNLIDEASAAVERYCHRTFARAVVKETLPSFGRLRLSLSRTPVVAITSVVYDDSTADSTTYSIEDHEAGFLYREDGWDQTPIEDANDLVPRYVYSLMKPDWEVTYTGGYLLPGDDVSGSLTLSVLASTDSLNDSAGALPLCAAGDWLTFHGWSSTTLEDHSFKVLSRTASKIVLDSTTVVAEATTDVPRSVVVRQEPFGLPRDIERACLVAIKSWYFSQKHDPSVSSKQVGDLSLTYSVTALERVLPAAAQRLLAPYRRMV